MNIRGLVLPYKGIYPKIHETAYIAEGAVIVGDVEIGAYSSVWHNCVIRGDVQVVRIGERTNVQDGSVIHVTRVDGPTIIGSGITIGHLALLHACILEDDCFIGMGSKVMDKVIVEKGAMVGAGALVAPKKIVKSGEIWSGVPAKMMREMSQAEKDFIPISAENYVRLAGEYLLTQSH